MYLLNIYRNLLSPSLPSTGKQSLILILLGPPATKKRKTATAEGEKENGAGEENGASGSEGQEGEGEEEGEEEEEAPQETAKTSAPAEAAAKAKEGTVPKENNTEQAAEE